MMYKNLLLSIMWCLVIGVPMAWAENKEPIFSIDIVRVYEDVKIIHGSSPPQIIVTVYVRYREEMGSTQWTNELYLRVPFPADPYIQDPEKFREQVKRDAGKLLKRMADHYGDHLGNP